MYLIGTSALLYLLMRLPLLPSEQFELGLAAFSVAVILYAKMRRDWRLRGQLRRLAKMKDEYSKRFGRYKSGSVLGHASKIGTTAVGHATGGGFGFSVGTMLFEAGSELIGRPRDPEKTALKAKIKAQGGVVRWEKTKFWAFLIAHFSILYLFYNVLGLRGA